MADTITIRTSTERDVIKIVERGPQGPAGGGGGGSGTVTSVALASSDLTITGSPITTSGTITANLSNSGATAGTYTKVTVDAKGRVTAGATATAADVGAATTAHTHLAADVTDLSLNKVPEARQTYNITSTNSALPTQADAQSAFQNLNSSIDCVIVLNNTTGVVYADIVVPDLLNTPGSQRGRVVVETQVSGAGDFTNFRINVEGTIVYGYDEIQPTERLVFVWTGNSWNLETIHTATQPKRINLPSFAGTLALTSDITKTAVGLGNVTNNAQTQAAIVPNTAPSAGQLLVGNAGGTAYAPASVSGDATLASTGALTLANNSTARSNLGLGNSATLNTGTTAGTVAAGDHTHSQLHDRSHAITSTSDHTATANRVFYSNNSGQVTELALGAANTVLTSNGTTSAPTFSALPSGGSKTYFRATALDNQPPSTGFATLDTRNSIAVLDFDDASTESAVFVGVIPEGASLGSGLIVYLHFMATTATSGNVRWSVAFERSNTDLDADSFDTATAATVATNGTSGIVTVGSITCTTIDSVAAGDLFRFRVQRLGADAADTMSGDAELVAVEIRSAA